MKTVFTLIILACVSLVNAQSTYESPYVNEGKSYKFVVPEKFHLISDESQEMSLYSVDPELDMDAEKPTADCIILGVVENDENMTPEDMLKEIVSLESLPEDVEVEEFSAKSGQQFVLASGNLGIVDEDNFKSYIGASVYGDVIAVCMLIDVEDDHNSDMKNLKDVLRTFEEYTTDRENAFVFYSEEWEDWEDEPYFDNSEYTTVLNYMSLEFGDAYEEVESNHWEEEMGMDFPELLLAYAFVNQEEGRFEGGIKVFSGGPGENFRSTAEKLEAAQKIYHGHGILNISNMTEVHGDQFTFARYDVEQGKTDGATSQHLYITHCEGDIVFVLAYETEEASDYFKATLEDFVKSMMSLTEMDGE